MRAHTGTFLVTTVIVLAMLLSGCSVFNRAPVGATPAPDTASTEALAFTQAAETIVAELTANAPAVTEPAEVQAAPTNTPEVLPPTSTPKPTNTPLPSDTPEPSATPLPTATDTPAVPPTATLPPEPSWLLSSTDDFSFGFWPTEGTTSIKFHYTMGGYSILNENEQSIAWSTRSDQFAGVRLEVETRKLSGPMDGYYGVVCNFANGGNYYFLGVGSDGWYGIGLQYTNKMTWLIEGIDTTGAVHTGGSPNVIRADCANGMLSLWSNGTLIATVQDKTFSAGAIGMGVGSRKVGKVDVLFDNFSVYLPETATATPTP